MQGRGAAARCAHALKPLLLAVGCQVLESRDPEELSKQKQHLLGKWKRRLQVTSRLSSSTGHASPHPPSVITYT